MKVNKSLILLLCLFTVFSFLSCNQNNNHSSTKPPTANNDESDKIDNENYSIKPNIIYYLLTDEYLDNNDVDNPDISVFKRYYIVYDGIKNQTYSHTKFIGMDKIKDIQEARKFLMLDNPNQLELLPNTIVSNDVLDKWKLENYNGFGSYSENSPKNLDYSKIQ